MTSLSSKQRVSELIFGPTCRAAPTVGKPHRTDRCDHCSRLFGLFSCLHLDLPVEQPQQWVNLTALTAVIIVRVCLDLFFVYSLIYL
jgi:hypothetical protein